MVPRLSSRVTNLPVIVIEILNTELIGRRDLYYPDTLCQCNNITIIKLYRTDTYYGP